MGIIDPRTRWICRPGTANLTDLILASIHFRYWLDIQKRHGSISILKNWVDIRTLYRPDNNIIVN